MADDALDAVRRHAVAYDGTAADLDGLGELVGDAQVVLLGEATHGTHEFYAERARITQRLIEQHGFCAVAAEADWPDAYRVTCHVRGSATDDSAEQALRGFSRFPRWMWRNTDVAAFVEWLRAYNRELPSRAPRAGFFGLDLYSLFSSTEEVIRYLERVDPDAAARARARYACFDHADRDSQSYGYAASRGLADSCEQGVVEQLLEMQRRSVEPPTSADDSEEARFHAEQNALLVKDAEEYYRSMFRGGVSSWNIRDQHMARSLDRLVDHLSRRRGQPAKVVVWAHNSHLGDARATAMGRRGEVNVGQLVRERYGDAARLIGFSTFDGTVAAADDWGGDVRVHQVRQARPGSWEHLLHGVGVPRLFLPIRALPGLAAGLRTPRLERAIGVIYRPQTELVSHYFEADLAAQFDAVIHVDQTTAVTPLDAGSGGQSADAPETYPTAV